MNCERIREQIPEALAGRLERPRVKRLVEHLEGCSRLPGGGGGVECGVEGMEALKSAKETAPDPAAKARFLEMLEAYQAGMGVAQAERAPVRTTWWFPVAAGVAGQRSRRGCWSSGYFAGRYRPSPGRRVPEVAQLQGQVESLRQMVALSMMQQQSPSARLRGVSYSEQIAQPDPAGASRRCCTR